MPLPVPDHGKSDRHAVLSWLRTFVGLAALMIAGRALFSLLEVPSYVVPPFSTVLHALFDNWSLILDHVKSTVVALLLGFAVGNLAAFAMAALIIHDEQVSRILLSISVFLRSVPIVALTPILTLWLGLFLAPKVAIVALLTFFPTVVVTARGLTSVDPQILDVLTAFNASRVQIFLKVRIPASAPYVFSGLRIAAPSAVSGAIVAEWLGSSQGIGHLMAIAAYEFRTDLLWATIVVAAALGIIAYALIVLLQRLIVPWSVGNQN